MMALSFAAQQLSSNLCWAPEPEKKVSTATFASNYNNNNNNNKEDINNKKSEM